MSASLISGYTGLLENPQVTKVARILGIPITTGAVVYGRYGYGGPTETTSFTVQRTALYDAIKAHQSDAQTEGEVFALLGRWDAAVADESNADQGLRDSVPGRKRKIREELQIIYPVFMEEGSDMILGR